MGKNAETVLKERETIVSMVLNSRVSRKRKDGKVVEELAWIEESEGKV